MSNRTLFKSRPLTQERLRELLHYDPVTGDFTRRMRVKGSGPAGSVAGSINEDGYVVIVVDYRRYYGHRLAWFYVTGRWPDPQCDHDNRIRHDNRWENLREATIAEQRQNQAVKSHSKTGVRGVHFNEKAQRYRARITVDGVVHVLGQGFLTVEEASAAYLAAKARLHPFQPIPRDVRT